MKFFFEKLFQKQTDYLGNLLSNKVTTISVSQKTLCIQIQLAIKQNVKLRINDFGLRFYSQHDEDGILLYIFSLIGTTNKMCVEICAGDGIECNCANLIINHRWTGLLVDGSEENVKKGTEFYANHPDTKYWPPQIIQKWITAENVNAFLEENGYTGEIDLLSLDIDGIDYWLWKAIITINPRVVVLEFNHLLGPNKSVTVPYDPKFEAEFTEYGSDYAGASLSAFVKLGNEKGYRLVAVNSIGTNAFFVRKDLQHPSLPEIEVANCFDHPRVKFGINVRFPKVKNREWIEV